MLTGLWTEVFSGIKFYMYRGTTTSMDSVIFRFAPGNWFCLHGARRARCVNVVLMMAFVSADVADVEKQDFVHKLVQEEDFRHFRSLSDAAGSDTESM